MIVCPYNPCIYLGDIGDVFHCLGCPDCRLLTSLCAGSESILTEEDEEK